MKKVIVGLSGGVDSSVAAFLLQKEGYQVEGMFMKNWEQDDTFGYCAAEEDLKDVKAVCKKLNIPLHEVNFSKAYWENVFEDFLSEFEKGFTPNPDVICNREIKFKYFFQHAKALGADYIATGHYARVVSKNAVLALGKSKDRDKDQTYFLHAIDGALLPDILFPLGGYLKADVRLIAKELGLVNHAKKDSTGICFIGERHFSTFLKEYMLAKPGLMKDTNGINIGQHDGLMFYTIGQRKGLKVGGRKDGGGEPWYVVEKDLKQNELIIAQGYHHPRLYAQGLICEEIHWISKPRELPHTCYAKTRYRQVEQACLISPADGNKHYVMFSEPQRAITAGQYVVFYDGNICLGGAKIVDLIR